MAGSKVGDAYIEIGADATAVDRQLGRQTPTIGQRAGGVLSNAFGVALGLGMARVTSSVTSSLNTAFSQGFSRLSSIDQAQAKLEGLGHSTETVASVMDSALSSVRGTAYGLGDAAGVAATMIAAGIAPGEDLTRTLTLLADTTTIAGTSLNDVGGIFTKVATTGKLTGESLAQLQERGVPALKFVAEEMGVTLEEAGKLVSQGKVDFATFQAAMERGLGGAAQSSGDTFVGAMANVRAALGRLGAEILGPAFSQMPDFFKQVIPILDGMAPSMSIVGDAIGSMMTKVIGWSLKALEGISGLVALLVGGDFTGALSNAFGWEEDAPIVGFLLGLREKFTSLVDFISAHANIFAPLAAGAAGLAGLSTVLGPLSALGPMLGPLAPIVTRLGGGLSGLMGPLRGLGGIIMGHPLLMLATVLIGIVSALAMTEGGVESISETLTSMVSTVTNVLNNITSAIPQILPQIIDAVVGVIQQLAAVLPTLLPMIAQAAVTLFMSLVDAVVQIVPPLLDAVLALVMALVGALPTLIPALLNAAITLFMGIVQALPEIIPMLIEGVISAVMAVVDLLPTLISTLLAAAVDLLMAIVQALPVILPVLLEAVISVITAVVELLPTLITTLLNAAVELMLAIVEALPIILPQLIQAVIQVIMAVVRLIPTLISSLIDAAKALFMGIVQAVPQIVSALVSAVGDLIRQGIDAVRTYGPQALQAGRDLIQGIVNGMNGMASAVTNKIREIASNALDAVKNFFGIGSPSKVMDLEVGVQLGTGLIRGVDRIKKQVKDSMTGLSTVAMSGFDLPSQVGAMPGTTSNVNPGAPSAGGGNTYVFEAGAFALDVADLDELRTIEDFLKMLRVKVRTA